MWIDDVVSLQVISSVDHNRRRDRLVQTFANMSEANSHIAALPIGAVMCLDDTGLMYHKFAGSWRAVLPLRVDGGIVNPAGYYISGGAGANIFTFTIPPGYVNGFFWLTVHMASSLGGPLLPATAALYLAGTGTNIGVGSWQVSNVAETFAMHAVWGVNVGGESGLVTMSNGGPPGGPGLNVNANGIYTRCTALLTPS